MCSAAVEDENVQLILNYRGEDVEVSVDLPTANTLLNNPTSADEFLEQWLDQQKRSDDGQSSSCSMQPEDEGEIIWKKKKPDRLDRAATDFFLSLREKYQKQFDDKKTQKSQIWKKIAKEMEEAGYKLGDNGAEKCRQKFSNLQKQYLAHVKHVKQTGSEHKEPPPYFTEMHGLLSMKDKVAPQHLQDSVLVESDDSLQDDTSSTHSATPTSSTHSATTSSAERIMNRFGSVQRSIRPQSANAQVIEILQKHHNEDKASKDKLIELITQQNAQRDKMLDLMSQLVNNIKEK